MVLVATNFTALIQAMGLSQGTYKPCPSSHTDHAPLPVADRMAGPSDNRTHGSQLFGNNYLQQQSTNSSLKELRLLDFDPANCAVLPYDPPDLGILAFSPFDHAKATVYRYRQQQSVNLGSWFVHEAWMTPSLFTCAAGNKTSELDIASGWGSLDSARAVLERHWDSFITASDLHYLASIGINTVRLPIGYWSLGPNYCVGTPFEPVASVYQNSWPRVVRTINMAADEGIGVLVDLHGAPGSQNGQPHSGISDRQVNLFGNDGYINKTTAVLTFLMQELVNVTNVVGIQILNEPQNVDTLADFYSTVIATMRQISQAAKSFPLYLHDGFDLTRFSDFVANRSDFVIQDHHSYFVYTPEDESEPASQHTADIQGSITDSLAMASDHQRRNLVIDEFSCALTDQSLANEQNPYQALKDFCTGQLDIYQNKTAGWAFWAYNKEDCSDDPGWCFKAAVGRSLPPTFFAYGKGPLTDPTHIPALADMVAGNPASPDLMMAPSSSSSSSDAAQSTSPTNEKRDDASQLPLDPSQRAIAKGYSDGFLTAKIFALYGISKLGFIGQYIHDSISRLGLEIIQPGMEHNYKQWFMEGLNDGENLISSYVDQVQI